METSSTDMTMSGSCQRSSTSPGSSPESMRIPPRAYCSRYIEAMAKKCGSCHRKMSANTHSERRDSVPCAAAAPASTGIAPGMAPTQVLVEVRRLSGV